MGRNTDASRRTMFWKHYLYSTHSLIIQTIKTQTGLSLAGHRYPYKEKINEEWDRQKAILKKWTIDYCRKKNTVSISQKYVLVTSKHNCRYRERERERGGRETDEAIYERQQGCGEENRDDTRNRDTVLVLAHQSYCSQLFEPAWEMLQPIRHLTLGQGQNEYRKSEGGHAKLIHQIPVLNQPKVDDVCSESDLTWVS